MLVLWGVSDVLHRSCTAYSDDSQFSLGSLWKRPRSRTCLPGNKLERGGCGTYSATVSTMPRLHCLPAHTGDGEAVKGHRGGQAASGAARRCQRRSAEGARREAAADHAGLHGAQAICAKWLYEARHQPRLYVAGVVLVLTSSARRSAFLHFIWASLVDMPWRHLSECRLLGPLPSKGKSYLSAVRSSQPVKRKP